MRRLMSGIALGAIGLAACGPSPAEPPPERTLSAAAAAESSEVTVPPPSTSTIVHPTTTTARPAVASTTVGASGQPAAARRASSPAYLPAPPPPGVRPDGYGGYGGTTTSTADGTSVTLQVYPREQYLGERVQVSVRVSGTTAIRSIAIDLGDGTVVNATQLQSWGCPTESRETGAGAPAHVYSRAAVYRIRAVVTAVACTILPGPPGGWTLPDGRPAVGIPLPWAPAGPDQAISAAMDVTQRPDRHPPPVGPPPGP